MNIGALRQLVKQGAKQNKIVGNPFSSKDDIENYFRSEIRRGALPKKNQKYFDTFDPNIYYHSTIEDIDKFDPQMSIEKGAYGQDSIFDPLDTRGATYFTSDKELANQVLQDKRIMTQAEYNRQKRNMGSGQYPDFDVDTVYNPKTDEEFLSASRIYPVKIKTDKLFDFEDDVDFDKLEEKILAKFSDESDEYKLLNRVQSGEWSILERPQIQKELKELGFTGYRTSEAGTVGLFNPDKGDVRSLYAKFDPKEAKSGEILATIVPYASVGTIGALAGLDEGT
tara:strand:+ start:27632 stop:28477 length:846 start_codon:yes stop_codon:yes gene_type:complete